MSQLDSSKFFSWIWKCEAGLTFQWQWLLLKKHYLMFKIKICCYKRLSPPRGIFYWLRSCLKQMYSQTVHLTHDIIKLIQITKYRVDFNKKSLLHLVLSLQPSNPEFLCFAASIKDSAIFMEFQNYLLCRGSSILGYFYRHNATERRIIWKGIYFRSKRWAFQAVKISLEQKCICNGNAVVRKGVLIRMIW